MLNTRMAVVAGLMLTALAAGPTVAAAEEAPPTGSGVVESAEQAPDVEAPAEEGPSGRENCANPEAEACEPSPSTQPSGEPSIHIAADGSPQAGESIDIFIRCAAEVGHPSSPVLWIDGRLFETETPDDLPLYQIYARIKPGTSPGAYPVTATCGDETLTWTFRVYPDDGGDQGRDDTSGGTGDGDQVDVVPLGAPETGGGPGGGALAAALTALGLTGFLGGAGLAARRRARR